MKTRTIAALFIVLLSASAKLSAQSGGVAIRIDDRVASRCINGQKDRVWVVVRRVILEKTGNLFTEDSSVALIVRATFRTDPAPAKQLRFPAIAEATLKDYSIGQVSIPIEYGVVEGMDLKQQHITYAGFTLDLTVVNKRGKTGWGKALEALAEVANKLPLPPSPATEAGTYLLDFADKAIGNEVAAQDPQDAPRSASLVLEFDPSGQCATSNFERTGTIAVLQATGTKGSRYIDIDKTNEYCWDAEPRPSFVLKAASRRGKESCDTRRKDATGWYQVSNDYVAFVISAVASSRTLGPPPEQDLSAAQRRCDWHGLPREFCK
jgi:hypothetical protein